MKMRIIRAKNTDIKKAMHSYSELSTEIGDSNLLLSGAKASHKGGGWWRIHGYSWNGKDVDNAVALINK